MKHLKSVSYKPNDGWVGDVIPYFEDDQFYVYYLHDPRSGEEGVYAEDTTWYLLTTRDGINYEEHGKSIMQGDEISPNRNNYTGSIIKGSDKKYYAFFTAFNKAILFNNKPIQSVMRAVGDTPYNLKIDMDFRLLADNSIYQMHDWRDPYVFFNEDDSCYWMLLCSKEFNTSDHRGGCIALCKSTDLRNWTYEPPFYSPNMYVTMECPEIFKINDWYYLVFSTFSDRFVTHYRKSKNINGPWEIPFEDTFDCRANYAIKTAGTSDKRYAFGWIATKRGASDYGKWEWGGTLIVHELIQESKSGELYVKPTQAMTDFFNKSSDLEPFKIINAEYDGSSLHSEGLGALLYSIQYEQYSIELDIKITKSPSEFGLLINTDEYLENGYQLRFLHNTVAWDLWPRAKHNGPYQWQIKGDLPFQIETLRYLLPSKSYKIKLVHCDEIVLVYINNQIALSTRFYEQNTDLIGLYVVNGNVEIKNFKIMLRM